MSGGLFYDETLPTGVVYYPGTWTALGGPGAQLPTADTAHLTSDESAAMAVLHINGTWVVMDSQGAVHAECQNPADLKGWWDSYLSGLGELYESGQL
jgi:hypothetical protein